MVYLKPIRIAYKGDKLIAAKYVREARRRVAEVLQTLGSATAGRRSYKLPNNAGVLTIIIAGKDNITAIIDVGGGRKKARWFEDFVADSGVNAYEGGTLVYYPIIFQPNQDEQNPGWRTYFRLANAPGFKEAPEPKGTYSDVYYKKALENKMGGMDLSGGNRNHRNTEGEYVSWRTCGTYNYFVPPYRTSWASCTFVVWHQGYVLLNTVEFYQTVQDDGKGAFGVLGAGVHDGYLYVIQGGLQINMSYPTAPDPAPRRSAWVSPMYYEGSVYISCRRYKIYPFRDEISGEMHYRIVKEPPQILWEGVVPRAQNYWNFNADCSMAVSYELPAKANAVFIEGELTTTLTTSSLRYRIEIDTNAGTATALQSNAGNAIAEENGNVMYLAPGAGGRFFVTPWWTIPAMSYSYEGIKTTRFTFLDMTNGWAAGLHTREDFVYVSEDESTGEIKWERRTSSEAFVINPEGEETILGTIEGQSSIMYDIERVKRVEGLDKVMALNPSAMTLMYLQIIGCYHDVYVPDVNPEDPPLQDEALFFAYNPLFMFQITDSPVGGAMGGAKFSIAGAERDPTWGEWVGEFGFGPDDSPDPYPIEYPENFVISGSGAGTPHSVLFGVRFQHNPPYAFYQSGVGPGPVLRQKVFNYVNDGDLEELSGNTFNSENRYALSVSILGPPPLAQTLFY